MSPYVPLKTVQVKDLALYDVANTKGVAADLSHCNTPCSVSGYSEVGDALKGADLVIIPAGVGTLSNAAVRVDCVRVSVEVLVLGNRPSRRLTRSAGGLSPYPTSRDSSHGVLCLVLAHVNSSEKAWHDPR